MTGIPTKAEREECEKLDRLLVDACNVLEHGDDRERADFLVATVRFLRTERHIDDETGWNCDVTEDIPVDSPAGHQRLEMARLGYEREGGPLVDAMEALCLATTAIRDLYIGWPERELETGLMTGDRGLSALLGNLKSIRRKYRKLMKTDLIPAPAGAQTKDGLAPRPA